MALLLQDEEWGRWSDREVARRCGVSPTFVDSLRAELSVHGGQTEGARRMVERGGIVYEMATAKIGDPTTRLHEQESIIEHGKQAAGEMIRELEGLGVTLTPTGATFPPDLPVEKWRQIGSMLSDLHILAGLGEPQPSVHNRTVPPLSPGPRDTTRHQRERRVELTRCPSAPWFRWCPLI